MRAPGMSCRSGGLLLAALALGACSFATVHAGGHGEKIQFSDPSTPITASNLTTTITPGLNRLNPTPSRFQQVQDDLFRPLKDAIAADDPMQPVLTLPPPDSQKQQQSRGAASRARKQMDQQKNWAFTDLNDLYPETTTEEALGLKDTEPDVKGKEDSLIQKYYDRQNQKKAANPYGQNGETYDSYKQDYSGTTAFDPFAKKLPGNETFFGKNLFTEDDSQDAKPMAGMNDSAYSQGLSDEEQAAKKHRDEFAHLLDPSLPATKPTDNLFGNLPGQVGVYGQDNNASTQTTQSAAQPYRSVLYPAGLIDPTKAALHSPVFDDPTAAALGLPNPTTTIKPQTPPVTVESIQSMVNPFTANMMKRNF